MAATTTSYQRAVRGMSPAEIRELNDLFSAITDLGDPWHFVAPNVQQKEHFLPAPTMRRLLAKLKTLMKTPNDMESGYEEFCRKHQLCGRHVANSHLGSILGYAKEREVFCRYLHRTNPLFRSLYDAREFVRKLVHAKPLSRNESAVPLGLFTTWCTWSLHDDDPFSFAMTGYANEIRATLGLPPNQHDKLLVFRYDRREAGHIFRPTVLDAELHPFFEPSVLGERRFGQTRPWPMAHLDEHLRIAGVRLSRRPEGLHTPLTAAQLVTPTEEL